MGIGDWVLGTGYWALGGIGHWALFISPPASPASPAPSSPSP
ncbi:MAG: hypothetical protein V7L23_35940 [Nostoc sp.]